MLTTLLLCSALSSPAAYALAPVAQADVAAPAETPTIEDAGGLVVQIIQAAKDKNWQLLVAMIVMLIVALANFVLIKLDILTEEARKIALPWISAASGCLVVFASTLLAGGSWWTAILAGFVTGAAAVGLWELVFKHVKNALAKPKA